MAQQQDVTVSFSQGLNEKEDQWQLPVGQFQSLVNSVFTDLGALKKRNGYQPIGTLTGTIENIATLGPGILALGSEVQAYSPALSAFARN